MFKNLNLSAKLFLVVTPLFLLTFGVTIYLNYRFQEEQVLGEAQQAATSLANTVKKSMVHMMVKYEQIDDAYLRQLSQGGGEIENLNVLFYLDSFGSSIEDVRLMQFLREKLGPDVLTFSEHQFDALMPFSGGYSETTFDATPPPGHYALWSDVRIWEIYQYLSPGAQMISRLFETKGKLSADTEPVDRWFLRNQISPLLPIGTPGRFGDIREMQDQFLTSPGQWKGQ